MWSAPEAKVYVAGHRGLVGSALWRALASRGCDRLIGRTRQELDLRNGEAVREFLARERPGCVFVAAARVGGIQANDTRPAEFLYENLQIQNNLIHGAWAAGVRKLLFLGSSCIYPRLAPQPIREDSLLTGPLEPTNQWYAVAKIAGIKLCQAYRRQYGCDFIAVMPTNLYGPGDDYDPVQSHVVPGMIRRMHEAKVANARQVVCWGTGTPRRELLHVDDLARACLLLMEEYSGPEPINVGSGHEISIRELAERIRAVVGYTGELVWDSAKPDGTPRKILDSSRIHALGWKPEVGLDEGLRQAYADFLKRFGRSE